MLTRVHQVICLWSNWSIVCQLEMCMKPKQRLSLGEISLKKNPQNSNKSNPGITYIKQQMDFLVEPELRMETNRQLLLGSVCPCETLRASLRMETAKIKLKTCCPPPPPPPSLTHHLLGYIIPSFIHAAAWQWGGWRPAGRRIFHLQMELN